MSMNNAGHLGLKLRSFYEDVEAQNFSKVLSIFAENVEYLRGPKILLGKKEVDEFYRSQRDLDGKHTIEHLVVVENEAFVIARFVGYHAHTPIDIRFADYFVFDKNDKVVRRESFSSRDFL